MWEAELIPGRYMHVNLLPGILSEMGCFCFMPGILAWLLCSSGDGVMFAHSILQLPAWLQPGVGW